jgi:SAM-dependent methyltransferase
VSTSTGRLEWVRRTIRGVGPVRSVWLLLRAVRGAVKDGPRRNRRRVDREFSAPDPWSYATSEAEQDCFRHQLNVLDRSRNGQLFGDACEIGCAEGFFTERLAERCTSLLALELSPTALARARERRDWGQHVRFARWDLRRDPLPGTFDLIVLAGVLEYFDRRSALRVARNKVVAGLRPGGHLFLVTTRSPGAEDSWWGRLLPRGARINEFVGAHPSLRPLLAEGGDEYVIGLFERAP